MILQGHFAGSSDIFQASDLSSWVLPLLWLASTTYPPLVTLEPLHPSLWSSSGLYKTLVYFTF